MTNDLHRRSGAGTCRYCGGPQALTETATQCPECGWHECSSPAVIHADHLTCPECGHEW
jgi:hypothetical protein